MSRWREPRGSDSKIGVAQKMQQMPSIPTPHSLTHYDQGTGDLGSSKMPQTLRGQQDLVSLFSHEFVAQYSSARGPLNRLNRASRSRKHFDYAIVQYFLAFRGQLSFLPFIDGRKFISRAATWPSLHRQNSVNDSINIIRACYRRFTDSFHDCQQLVEYLGSPGENRIASSLQVPKVFVKRGRCDEEIPYFPF